MQYICNTVVEKKNQSSCYTHFRMINEISFYCKGIETKLSDSSKIFYFKIPYKKYRMLCDKVVQKMPPYCNPLIH